MKEAWIYSSLAKSVEKFLPTTEMGLNLRMIMRLST